MQEREKTLEEILDEPEREEEERPRRRRKPFAAPRRRVAVGALVLFLLLAQLAVGGLIVFQLYEAADPVQQLERWEAERGKADPVGK